MASETKALNKEDWKDWLINLRVFALSILVIYLTPIGIMLSVPNHVVSLHDFAITSFTIGAIFKYLIDAILGLAKKYYQGT